MVQELIKKVKQDYCKMQVDESKNCPKNMWRCVENIENKSYNKVINEIKLENVRITRGEKVITDHFNIFYAEISGNLAKN